MTQEEEAVITLRLSVQHASLAERALPLDFFDRRTGIDLLLGTLHR